MDHMMRYANGHRISIGDVVLVDTDTGRCAIIEHIDAAGLSGRYSGSDEPWNTKDIVGVRLMRQGTVAERGYAQEAKPDPYAQPAGREEEIYQAQVLMDTARARSQLRARTRHPVRIGQRKDG